MYKVRVKTDNVLYKVRVKPYNYRRTHKKMGANLKHKREMKNLKELINQRNGLWADGRRPTTEERLKVEDAISNLWQSNQTAIGEVGNYYGGLSVVENNGAYFWAIENYDGWMPEEITKELYYALITFNTKEK